MLKQGLKMHPPPEWHCRSSTAATIGRIPTIGNVGADLTRNDGDAMAAGPKTADGRFIDLNTGEPIEGPYDPGHKLGHSMTNGGTTWRRTRQRDNADGEPRGCHGDPAVLPLMMHRLLTKLFNHWRICVTVAELALVIIKMNA